jgi:hypothetical protein
MQKPALVASLVLALAGLVACDKSAAPTPAPKTYSVADLYRNVEFGGLSFTSDGSQILVSSNRSGIYNVDSIPVDGGEPVALTSSTTGRQRPARPEGRVRRDRRGGEEERRSRRVPGVPR